MRGTLSGLLGDGWALKMHYEVEVALMLMVVFLCVGACFPCLKRIADHFVKISTQQLRKRYETY